MNPSTPRVVTALRRAIQAEIDGRNFYRMAALSTSDPRGREVFVAMGEEEEGHHQFLARQLHSVLTHGRADESVHLGAAPDPSLNPRIFSEKLLERIEEAHYEMTSLSVAVQLELNALTFYREEARASDDPVVRGFFDQLADWETGHYHALLREQEALKERYWEANGFSPM